MAVGSAPNSDAPAGRGMAGVVADADQDLVGSSGRMTVPSAEDGAVAALRTVRVGPEAVAVSGAALPRAGR
jgi:hypothetical protein